MTNSSVSMKLLIDTQAKRVLFAEASKDFVDLLFHILSLPLAKVTSLLGKKEMVGSVSNLYESIENLDSSYIQPNQTKDTLLKPVSPITGYSVPLLTIDGMPDSKKLYRCSCCNYEPSSHVSDDPFACCLKCGHSMNVLVQSVAQGESSSESGFVKGGVVTYMVLDDLVVLPMCTVSTNIVLNKLDVKDVSVLEEKVVSLGRVEAVKLLKASLETKDVLTHVFMNDLDSLTMHNQCTEKEATTVSKLFETMRIEDGDFPVVKFELEDEACVHESENEEQMSSTFTTKALVSESINEAQITSAFRNKVCVSVTIDEQVHEPVRERVQVSRPQRTRRAPNKLNL